MRRAAGGVHSVSLEKKLVSGHGEAGAKPGAARRNRGAAAECVSVCSKMECV